MRFPHLPHTYFYHFPCSDSEKMWREVLRPCLTYSIPGNHCPPTRFASAQEGLREQATAIACCVPQCVFDQDPAPNSNIESSGLSILLPIQTFMLLYCIYQLAQFSESSKNWKVGETFCRTQIPQWQSQKLGHSTFGMQNNEEGDGMLTQTDVPKEKGCLKLCVSTFQVFPSRTMLEAQILKVPRFQNSSKKPSFLHFLPPPPP